MKKSICLLMAITASAGLRAGIAIDGNFADWSTIPQNILAESSTDAKAENKALYSMKFCMDAEYIYFYLEFSGETAEYIDDNDNKQIGDTIHAFDIALSTDNDPTTGFNFAFWENSASDYLIEAVDYDFENAGLYNFASEDQGAFDWEESGISGFISTCNPVALANKNKALEGKILIPMLPAKIKTLKVGVFVSGHNWEQIGNLPQTTLNSDNAETLLSLLEVPANTTSLAETSVEPVDTTTVVQERQSTFLNFSDVQSIDDWTITNATLNETETTMYDYLETYVYDIYSNIPGVAYVTDMPDITFTMESTSDKTKAFYVGINRGYYGFYQTGGKNGIITIKNTRPYDIITLEVAAKGATAADFTDPKGQFPINAVAMTSDLVLPAKNSGAEGEDDSGYTYRTLVYYSTGGDVQIKECTAGFRLRTLSIEPGEGPTITVMGQEIPTDTTGVIDIYGDSTLIYDTEENTLTLSNLNLEVGEDESAAISYSGMEPLTIVLNDSSTIVADTVIYSAADIVITGDGHLAAEGVTPITGSPAASITFEAVNMHVRSLPSSAAVRRRIKGGKRLDETGGPALSGFGSADFNKTNVSPSDAEYGVVTTTDGSGNQTTIKALYIISESGEQEVVTEFELTASTTAVESIRVPQPFDPSQPMYNILGIPVDAAYKGLVIQNGQTFILK